jgi:hypothetical protein
MAGKESAKGKLGQDNATEGARKGFSQPTGLAQGKKPGGADGGGGGG